MSSTVARLPLPWVVIAGLMACDAAPETVARDYLVAAEHGYARQAYALLSQADRDVRAFRDFRDQRVRDVEERLDRILARRTKVAVKLTEQAPRTAQVFARVARVDIDEASHALIAGDLKTGGPAVATRLQRMELPVRTSTMTVTLRREAAGWRVFLDLAAWDEAARVAELNRLKAQGRARMISGDFGWARETYEAARRLAPDDLGVRHALAVLDAVADQEAVSARRAKLARAYRTKVVVERVAVEANRITGEVRNTGDQVLDEVELTITGLDKDGAPVTETVAHPVHVSPVDGGAPLPAGHARRFEATLERAPAAWKGAVEVRVTEVRFHLLDE